MAGKHWTACRPICNAIKLAPWRILQTHTCWCTSASPLLRFLRHLQWTIHLPICVCAPSLLSGGDHDVITYLSIRPERRIDEERVQIEARKREREEQPLFLTAKVCMFFSCTSQSLMVYISGHHRWHIYQSWWVWLGLLWREELAPVGPAHLPSAEAWELQCIQEACCPPFQLPWESIPLVGAYRPYKQNSPSRYPHPRERASAESAKVHTVLFQYLTFVAAVEMIRKKMKGGQNDLRLYLDVITNPSKVIGIELIFSIWVIHPINFSRIHLHSR